MKQQVRRRLLGLVGFAVVFYVGTSIWLVILDPSKLTFESLTSPFYIGLILSFVVVMSIMYQFGKRLRPSERENGVSSPSQTVRSQDTGQLRFSKQLTIVLVLLAIIVSGLALWTLREGVTADDVLRSPIYVGVSLVSIGVILAMYLLRDRLVE